MLAGAVEEVTTRGPSVLHQQGYLVVQMLGRGAHGDAFLVRRGRERGLFVAKIQSYADKPEQGKLALAREVTNMRKASLSGHPYLVRFRQSFQDSTHLCIIMDYCEEADLAVQIRKQRQSRQFFPEGTIKRWLCELIAALDYLHCLHLLHRDVKPGNIFMSNGGARLGDFGLSKQVSAGVTNMNLHTQCGSPLYLAPEVHMGQPYSKSVDMWGLGCTLFEMMMLNFAFRGSTVTEVMRKIVYARHEEIQGGWTPNLVKIVHTLLSLKPTDRPTTPQLICDTYFQSATQEVYWDAAALSHRM